MRSNSHFFRRLVRPYFLIIAIVIAIAMCIVYYAVSERVKNNAINSGKMLASQISQQMDMYVNELDILSNQVERLPTVNNIFKSLDKNTSMDNYFDNHIPTAIDISSKLKDLLISRSHTHRIIVYNGNGDYLSSSEYMTQKSEIKNYTDPINYNSMNTRLNYNNGTIVQYIENEDNESYISFKRSLIPDSGSEPLGIIETRCYLSFIKKAINNDNYPDASIKLRSNGGTVLYTFSSLQKNKDPFFTADVNMNKAEWSIEISLENPVNTVFKTQLTIILVLLYIMLLSIMYAISIYIGHEAIKPITELTKRISDINAADEPLNMNLNTSPDEIKELDKSFGKMLERLNFSLQQEKKAYALAIQAQMNPHFLYNTLAVIGSAGAECGCDNVMNMCIELSDMLRYITSYQNVSVKLQDEITHTKNYLSLMKSRYEDYFTYDINIDERLMDISIPKLIIQPLVENCFSHGFKDTQPPWHIQILMEGVPGHWALEVHDNGTGITAEAIEEIDKKVELALKSRSLNGIGGLGVVNTIVRIKLLNEESFWYRIGNDDGTVVRIVSG